MCTAARSEICDRRQRGIHERRRSAMTPKERRDFGRRTRGRPGSVTAGGENSARSGAGMPPGRQAVVAPPPALHADDVAQARDRRRARGARAAPRRADQSLLASPSTSRKRGWQCDQVTAVVRFPRGRDRRGAGAASPTADAAKRRSAARDDAVAKFFPPRGSRNLFLLSAHGHEAIMPACGDAKETKRS